MSGCTFGIILNIITLLIIFTIVYMFYGIYFKTAKNNKGTLVNATQVLKSVISGNKPIKEITKTKDFPKYNWYEDKEPNKNGMLTVRSYPIR